jgi:lipopolysaccharide export system permease protein
VFLVNERFAPQAALMAQEIRQGRIEVSAKGKGAAPATIKYLFFYGTDNKLFFIDEFDPATKSVSGITVISQDQKQRMNEKVTAFKGQWTGSGWKLFNCQVARYNPDDPTNTNDVQFFKEKTFGYSESPDELMKQRLNVSAMNIRQTKAYIKRFKASGAVVALNNLKVDLHQKIAYPFSCIIIIFAGMPFALVTGKRKGLTFASVGIAMAIGFLFYVVNAVGLALGKGGVLHPVASAWMAPGMFTAAGIYLIRKLF